MFLTSRPPSERAIDNRARMAFKQLVRAERRLEDAKSEMELARRDLEAIREAETARFGRPIPANALLLDILGLVDIEDGDVWRWRGLRNNKDLATIRVARSEKSVVRFLAIEFGLIGEHDWGILYPTTDPDDVNPWHRELRPSARPIGNEFRFSSVSGGAA